MIHVPASLFRRVPWKNGRGATRVVAVDPAGADAMAFQLRISVATVDEDGAFSQFPGVDRWILALDAPGMVLSVDGETMELDPGVLARFSGDGHSEGRLRGAPVRDLNVMVRRPHRARVEVTEVSGWDAGADAWIYVLSGSLGPAIAGDALWVAAGERVEGRAKILFVEGWVSTY